MSRIRVRVKPGSRKGPLVETGQDGMLTVHVRQRAVDGAANEGMIAVLADHFDIPRRDVTIASGHTARIKTVILADR